MISHQRLFQVAILLLASGIILNVTLTRLGHFDGSTFSALSIPLGSGAGYFAAGIGIVATVVAGLLLLLFSLKQKRTAAFILSLAVVILLPPMIQSVL